ncbi:hypothetical protein DV096_15265 [Bradymonadaceae bacterium TMQ3]|uniref:Uncharacterized protein n=1 Tax=Lujinxingia sediminis TaxID=2480984 RepID=A0ABY0CVN3_9DELT|nr:hypothetical protein [Lujinxingia sediminis]RDV37332.1 hypothetical protein DV096_15265 [Bradymonadaceae bacterium TMQ3]RVU46719.1 hypothetical protein EA187_06170 [Lujinxingia sediminis]TXC74730.1 hypothetical protein FRC91_14315 [Bradymonadales bacterium TMQ1]
MGQGADGERWWESGRLAVVGVAKNCGKTTTLNALIARQRGRAVGLVSVGIDGEQSDVLLGTEKPAIVVGEGHWVVSAERALSRSTAPLEYVRALGVSSPLGEVMVARARGEGEVVLAGLRHRGDVSEALDALEGLGAEPVFVDGAYGRVVGAHPEVAGAIVMSTGAVVGQTVQEVVRRTFDVVDRLTLPVVEGGIWRDALTCAQREQRAYLVEEDGELRELPHASGLVGLSQGRKLWRKSTAGVVVPGLVSDRVLEELLAVGTQRRRMLVVGDGTALHPSGTLWRRFRRSWEVRVGHTSRLMALTYNPSSITGAQLDARALRQGLEARWPQVPVFNPVDPDEVARIFRES